MDSNKTAQSIFRRRIVLTVLVVSVVLAAAVSVWAATRSEPMNLQTKQVSNTSTSQMPAETTTPPVTEAIPETTTTKAGTYVPYSPSVIQQTPGTKILFFHANWCPQCRKLEASIKNSSLPGNTTIIKVDYDDSSNLKKKYGVTIQTTLVKVSDDGTLLEKYIAYEDPTFAAVQKALL
jgi:thiol-disulfide isomerase/thioredoxin